jgi:wobble nucleotide-excising tRNase
MKISAIIICVFLVGIFNSNLFAGQVYTWTDENGNLHVTDTPPPPKSKIKDTLEYQKKTAAEIQALQDRKEQLNRKRGEEAKINRVEEAKKRAREADKAAQEAAEQANKITQEVEVYVRRLGSTKEKRKQFRKRIQREIQRAEAAQQRARQSVEDARQAAEEARQIEEEFNNQQMQTE